MRTHQHNLFDYADQKSTKKRYNRVTHGGIASKGRRKLERPLSSKHWIHLVLKSDKARGTLSLRAARNQLYIKKTIDAKAQKFGLIIGDFANVGNHLHIKVKARSRNAFQSFLRSITTLIARHVTSARQGRSFGRFWQGLAFTRVLRTYAEVRQLVGYFFANRIEVQQGQTARELFLEKFNLWIKQNRYGLPPDLFGIAPSK
jgi:hypothetical protein